MIRSTLTPQEFVANWRRSTLKESASKQGHFSDVCHLIGHRTPAEEDAEGQTFTFEKGADKSSGGQEWAHDLSDEEILARLRELNLARAAGQTA